jgi:hypothetical protein
VASDFTISRLCIRAYFTDSLISGRFIFKMPSYTNVRSLISCVTTDLTCHPRLVVPRRQRVRVDIHTPLLDAINSSLCAVYKPSDVVCFASHDPASKIVKRLCPKGIPLYSMWKILSNKTKAPATTKQHVYAAKVCVFINSMIPLDEMMSELRSIDFKLRHIRQSSQLYGGLQMLVVSSVYGSDCPGMVSTISEAVNTQSPRHDWVVFDDNEDTSDITNKLPASCLDKLTCFLFDAIMSVCSGSSAIDSKEVQHMLWKLQRVYEINNDFRVVNPTAVNNQQTIHILPTREINKVIETNIACLPANPSVFNKIQSKRPRPRGNNASNYLGKKMPYITDTTKIGVPDYCKYRFVIGMRVFACYPTGFKCDPVHPKSGRIGTIVHIKGSMMTELDPVVQWDTDKTITVMRRITCKCPPSENQPGFTSTLIPLAPAYAVTWEHLIAHGLYLQPEVLFVVKLDPVITVKHSVYLYWLTHQISNVTALHILPVRNRQSAVK